MERRTFLKNMFGAAVIAALPIPMFEQIVKAEETVPEPLKATLRLDNGFWLFDMNDKLLSLGNLEELDVRRNELGLSRGEVGGPVEVLYGKPTVYFKTSGKSLHSIVAQDFHLGKKYKAVYIKDNVQVFSDVYLESFYGLDTDSIRQFYNMTFIACGEVTVEIN